MSSGQPNTLSPLTSQADIYSDKWPLYDGYLPLDSSKSSIRLLHLSFAPSSRSLIGSLRHVFLDDQPDYCTLSYYWGAPVPKHKSRSIRLDGTDVLARPTLIRFLESLVSLVGPIDVWVDALCINQNDIWEKGQQVSMMGEIYKSARLTYAWLGEATADTDYLCQYLAGKVKSLVAKDIDSYMGQVLQRPYWERLWVIQEFALSQKVQLLIGDESPDMEAFDPIARTSQSSAMYERLCDVRQQKTQDQGVFDLFQLIARFNDSKCSDPRDKIYGLLSLVKSSIEPDYSLTTFDLLFRIMHAVLPPCEYYWRDDLTIPETSPVDIFHCLSICLQLDLQNLPAALSRSDHDFFAHPFHCLGKIGRLEPVTTDSPDGLNESSHKWYIKQAALANLDDAYVFTLRYTSPLYGKSSGPPLGIYYLVIRNKITAVAFSSDVFRWSQGPSEEPSGEPSEHEAFEHEVWEHEPLTIRDLVMLSDLFEQGSRFHPVPEPASEHTSGVFHTMLYPYESDGTGYNYEIEPYGLFRVNRLVLSLLLLTHEQHYMTLKRLLQYILRRTEVHNLLSSHSTAHAHNETPSVVSDEDIKFHDYFHKGCQEFLSAKSSDVPWPELKEDLLRAYVMDPAPLISTPDAQGYRNTLEENGVVECNVWLNTMPRPETAFTPSHSSAYRRKI